MRRQRRNDQSHNKRMQQISTEGVQDETRHTNGSPNPGQKTRPYKNQQKKRICKIVDFAFRADYRINLMECEKKDKYLDLARELKKLWNMKETIVPIVIGALGTITKGLSKDLEDLEVGGRVETI